MERESHGYLIIGDKDKSFVWAVGRASFVLGISSELIFSHPDFTKEEYDSFGIDESRRLKERASMRPLSGDKKVFIIHSHVFTFEAQNALLKLFEEPPLGTHFFIITQSSNNILPTLISRLTLIKTEEKIFSDREDGSIKEFLSSSPASRLLIVNKIVEKKDKDKLDKGEIDDFLDNLEKVVSEKIERRDRVFVRAMENIQRSRKYLDARGMSPKLVFEYLALSLPII